MSNAKTRQTSEKVKNTTQTGNSENCASQFARANKSKIILVHLTSGSVRRSPLLMQFTAAKVALEFALRLHQFKTA